MTTPLQLRLSADRGIVAMREHGRSDRREIRVDAGTPLGVTMHRYAIPEVKGRSAC
jgi:hypothetical protein